MFEIGANAFIRRLTAVVLRGAKRCETLAFIDYMLCWKIV